MTQRFLLASLSALALLTGCGRGDLVPAAGRVLIDGQPLERATITLMPDDPGRRPAAALSDDSGRFNLRTGNSSGVAPGRYRVLVGKDVPDNAAGSGESEPENKGLVSSASRTDLGKGMQQVARFPVRSVIPERYAHPTQSPLACEVPAAGTSDLEFVLESSP